MRTRRRMRTGSWVLIGAAALALTSWAIVFLLQPTAQEAAAGAARKRCKERGWPERLVARRYRDTGSGLYQGFQQEFEIDGTDPRIVAWVEVRRPLYAPFWRVAEIIEVQAEVDDD